MAKARDVVLAAIGKAPRHDAALAKLIPLLADRKLRAEACKLAAEIVADGGKGDAIAPALVELATAGVAIARAPLIAIADRRWRTERYPELAVLLPHLGGDARSAWRRARMAFEVALATGDAKQAAALEATLRAKAPAMPKRMQLLPPSVWDEGSPTDAIAHSVLRVARHLRRAGDEHGRALLARARSLVEPEVEAQVAKPYTGKGRERMWRGHVWLEAALWRERDGDAKGARRDLIAAREKVLMHGGHVDTDYAADFVRLKLPAWK